MDKSVCCICTVLQNETPCPQPRQNVLKTHHFYYKTTINVRYPSDGMTT